MAAQESGWESRTLTVGHQCFKSKGRGCAKVRNFLTTGEWSRVGGGLRLECAMDGSLGATGRGSASPAQQQTPAPSLLRAYLICTSLMMWLELNYRVLMQLQLHLPGTFLPDVQCWNLRYGQRLRVTSCLPGSLLVPTCRTRPCGDQPLRLDGQGLR